MQLSAFRELDTEALASIYEDKDESSAAVRDYALIELFRRACAMGEQESMAHIMKLQRASIAKKVRFDGAADEDIDDLIQETFIRFFATYRASHFAQAEHIRDILGYLKKCATTAKISFFRKRAQYPVVMELTNRVASVEPELHAQLESKRIHEIVMGKCRNAQERAIAQAMVVGDMKAKAFWKETKGEFGNHEEIARVLRNIRERLERDEELRTLLIDSPLPGPFKLQPRRKPAKRSPETTRKKPQGAR